MLIHPNKSCLLIVDIQDKLVPAIHEKEELVNNARWLAEIAAKLNVPVLTSEQYPQGLGHTISEIAEVTPADTVMEKVHFSCMSEPSCNETINAIRPNQVVIVGMEAHVCVLQTAIQLKQQAREVYIVADCVSSRDPKDKALALERMRQCGIYIVSREMVAFEWMQKSGTDTFREISKNYLR
ncbi:hydrolase [Neptuniibacter sp. UBA6509]|uniref:hydrolase n=1 Tax=Neptuniibacter sp. UBA6509 TaxID=1946976 RepID=UPI000C460C06|nr:hydrolase [Neptuniibacter sp. UBA6509]MAY43019.1 hydrolase [Oceanospirillaceae bacterium]|tara:strand:- start:5218 stop:5763 length:546 start_codon:yes stop_codon:yes gene_type:complete